VIGLKVDNKIPSMLTDFTQYQANPSLNTTILQSPANSIAANNTLIKLSLSADKQKQLNNHSASRKVQTAISMIQANNDVLGKIQALLQSGKELAVQASHETSTIQNKHKLQDQLIQVNRQIDQLNKTISKDSLRIAADLPNYNQNIHNIEICLKSDWLESAEKVVADRYGLTADGADLSIVFEKSASDYLAAVSYENGPSGKAYHETLHISIPAINPVSLPNGGNPPVYDDRIITHEMVHAIMGRTMNYSSLPTWFKEGTAEFIHGANERIASNLTAIGGGMKGAKIIQNALGNGTDQSWVNDSIHYSAATIAVRYLHDNIKANGHSGGIKDLLDDLRDHPSEDLNQALGHVSSYTSVKAFVNDFVHKNMGSAYIHKLDLEHQFTTIDTGAIDGADVDGGPVMDAKSVIPDIYHYTDIPLKRFKIHWPTQEEDLSAVAGEIPLRRDYALSQFDSKSLGIKNVDVIVNPSGALDNFNNALSRIEKQRAQLNEAQKQFEQSLPVKQNDIKNVLASEYETKIKFPTQCAAYVSAQANQQPEHLLKLL
jgi:flagellin